MASAVPTVPAKAAAPGSYRPMSAGSAAAVSSVKPAGWPVSVTVKARPCMAGIVSASPAGSENCASPAASSRSVWPAVLPSAKRRVASTVWLALAGTRRVNGKAAMAGGVRPSAAVAALAMVRLAGAASASRPLLPR